MSTVMIIESLPILRQAIAEVVQRLGHEVVAQADNGQDALLQARNCNPQLVVLELVITGLGGLDLIRRLKLHDPHLKVLVFSQQSPSHFARLCLQAGADGFVSKHDNARELQLALNAVDHGRSYFPRDNLSAQRTLTDNELDTLSARELTVLSMIGEGQSNQTIADQLSISFKTVSTYKTRLQEKLHVDSRLALAEVAHRNGIGLSAITTLVEPQTQSPPPQLQAQMAMLRSLVDTSPNAMFVRDREGRLLFCNQPFLSLHHTSFEQIEGQRFDEAFWFTPEQGRRIQAGYEALVEKGEPFSLTATIDFLGEPHHVHFFSEPYRDAAGQVLGIVGVIEDMTDRQTLLGQLHDAHEQTLSQYRQVKQFGRVVSGELNGPLRQFLAVAPSTKLPQAARVALTSLTAHLAQFEHLISLMSDRPPLLVAPLDIVELISKRVAKFNQKLAKGRPAVKLTTTEVATRNLWLDGQRLELLLVTLRDHFLEQTTQTTCHIKLATKLQPNGIVTLALEITVGLTLPHKASIALELCRQLAQSMEGSFYQLFEKGETQFLIEIEAHSALRQGE